MPIIVKIFTAILPYILNYIDKHSDDMLDRVYEFVGKKLGVSKVATVKFRLFSKTGKEIVKATAIFNYDILGEIHKESLTDGEIVISGLKKGKYDFTISSKDYKTVTVPIVFTSDSDVIEKVVVMEEQ